jgi:hypothetical protein
MYIEKQQITVSQDNKSCHPISYMQKTVIFLEEWERDRKGREMREWRIGRNGKTVTEVRGTVDKCGIKSVASLYGSQPSRLVLTIKVT